ncbi:MAG: LysR family transcriptional regulator, partial [Cyanobacteriota bacterium]|nr:LysR family transcriptional regulator [Cyanobacteriota bacterium]
DLMVRRQLKLITHPARYCSRASEAFRREVLPVFASPDSPLRQNAPRQELTTSPPSPALPQTTTPPAS